MTKPKWIGIDYGSKLAGTTVICYNDCDKLAFVQSKKKQDADVFILDFIDTYSPSQVFIDAPLSLPSAYFGLGEDYFYRACDRETKAMSPMFLGGLTARAMRLVSRPSTITFYETYPAYLVKKLLDLAELYNKKSQVNQELVSTLENSFNLRCTTKLDNWHQVDALLCWISGKRASEGSCMSLGNKEEGLIYC